MTAPLVIYSVDDRVGIVTLNRPDKLNAISLELKKALIERLHEADRDPATGVVVLRAAGRSFCAGYDISPNPARAARKGNALAWHESLTDDVALEITPWDMRKPVIASVRGHCLGGGCELVMMCDITIAADDALFGEPEIRFSNVGPALIMPFVIGFKRARELLYLGDPIDAKTALQYGMVNRVVPGAELEAEPVRVVLRLALHLVHEPSHHAYVGPHRQRRILEDLRRERLGGGHQLRRWHHAVHHPVLLRFLGGEHATGQRDLVGEARAGPEPRGHPVLGAAEPALDLADL